MFGDIVTLSCYAACTNAYLTPFVSCSWLHGRRGRKKTPAQRRKEGCGISGREVDCYKELGEKGGGREEFIWIQGREEQRVQEAGLNCPQYEEYSPPNPEALPQWWPTSGRGYRESTCDASVIHAVGGSTHGGRDGWTGQRGRQRRSKG